MKRYCVEGQCELDGLLKYNKSLREALERLVADVEAGEPRDEGLDMARAVLKQPR